MNHKLQTFLKRLLSTAILVAVLVGVVAWNEPFGYAAFICVLCNLATIEWYRMLAGRAQESNRLLILVVGLVYPWVIAWKVIFASPEDFAQVSANTFDYSPESQEALPITLFAFRCLLGYTLLAFVLELVRMDYRGVDAKNALHSLGTSLVAFIFPVWMLCFAMEALLQFPFSVYTLLWLVLATKMTDIFAYVCGVLLGRKLIKRPFSPEVSPKKTWEGIIGSFVLTSVCAWHIKDSMLSGVEMPAAVFFVLFMPALFVLSVAGDLAGSLIKRSLAVKDSGSLLPGIGGIYDLIDSPAFTIAFFVGIGAIFG